MIRLIDIKLNAAHPELPPPEAVTYTGSPSTVFIRGVPPNCGRWAITAVFVAASFPDGSTTTRAAVQSANGVWVATLPATATSGRTENGFRIIADGIDENGEAVTGYIVCVADFAVASLAVTPAPEPGETSYQMLYFDEAPSVLRKGDVTKIDGVLKFYNGSAWESFAASGTLDDAVTRTSANGVKSSGIWSAIWGALTALPTGFSSLYDWCVDQLSGKLSTSGGTVTGDIHMVNGLLDAGDVQTRSMFDFLKPGQSVKSLDAPENSGKALTDADISDSSSALGAAFAGKQSKVTVSGILKGDGAGGVSAATAGTDFQSPLSQTQLDNIAAVPNKANDADVVHTTGNETVGGVKTFGPEGVVVHDTQTGFSMKLLDTGIAVTDGSNTVYFYVPSIAGGGGTFALLSDVMLKADRALNYTPGHLAALDANGNPVDSDWTAGDLARYALTTKSIDNGAVALDDRAINAVAVSSSLASLTVNFPAATSGKARDFGLRLTVASGITTAPQLVLPQGVVCENADGTAPEIGADGAATILYFTETAAGVFLVKGEVVQTIS